MEFYSKVRQIKQTQIINISLLIFNKPKSVNINIFASHDSCFVTGFGQIQKKDFKYKDSNF